MRTRTHARTHARTHIHTRTHTLHEFIPIFLVSVQPLEVLSSFPSPLVGKRCSAVCDGESSAWWGRGGAGHLVCPGKGSLRISLDDKRGWERVPAEARATLQEPAQNAREPKRRGGRLPATQTGKGCVGYAGAVGRPWRILSRGAATWSDLMSKTALGLPWGADRGRTGVEADWAGPGRRVRARGSRTSYRAP